MNCEQNPAQSLHAFDWDLFYFEIEIEKFRNVEWKDT